MKPVIWLTGLSGSGKSTLATALLKELSHEHECVGVDGDILRSQSSNFNYSTSGRFANIEKAIEICNQNSDSIIIVSLISPLREMREMARSSLGERFYEVYVQSSLSNCIKRDVKGLYLRALNNEISNFTGISHPYEEPFFPNVVVNTEFFDIEHCAQKIILEIFNKERGE